MPHYHSVRRTQILAKYPGVRNCFGVDQSFKYVVVAMVLFQVLMAYLLQDSSWLLVWLQAYAISGTISHSLTLAVHECSHNLGFGNHKILQNRLLGFIANLPMCVPMSVSFKKYHIEHHRNLGEDAIDTDVPTELEARIFVGPIGKCLWLFLQPVFYGFRPFSIYKKSITDFEILNAIVQISFDILIIYFFGWKSFVYLFGGFIIGLGLHPLAAHFISDHYVLAPGQETYSYYGIINLVTFNVGYHVEHHDFPYVAGRNLPKVTKMAPEFYEKLAIHDSWLKLIWDFIFDSRFSLRNRVKRPLSRVQFYGVGAYASSHIYQFLASIGSPFDKQN